MVQPEWTCVVTSLLFNTKENLGAGLTVQKITDWSFVNIKDRLKTFNFPKISV